MALPRPWAKAVRSALLGERMQYQQSPAEPGSHPLATPGLAPPEAAVTMPDSMALGAPAATPPLTALLPVGFPSAEMGNGGWTLLHPTPPMEGLTAGATGHVSAQGGPMEAP